LKYSTWGSDAMPKPKREFLLEEQAWTDLTDAILEAVKRLKAQAPKEVAEYRKPRPWLTNKDSDRFYEGF